MKKPDRNAVKKAEVQRRFAVIKEVKFLASQIPDQDVLDMVLMQKEDANERYQLYKYMRPFLTFPNPQFPTTLKKSDIVQPKMIVRPN